MDQIRKAERITHLTPEMGLLTDISETGASLRLTAPTTSGTIVKLELTSMGRVLPVQAKIVHVRQGAKQAGIEFINMTAEQKQKIAEMVDDYSRGVPISARLAS
ncbi:MAG: PilZ domain-containing protein [Fibrobacterota bacterium]